MSRAALARPAARDPPGGTCLANSSNNCRLTPRMAPSDPCCPSVLDVCGGAPPGMRRSDSAHRGIEDEPTNKPSWRQWSPQLALWVGPRLAAPLHMRPVLSRSISRTASLAIHFRWAKYSGHAGLGAANAFCPSTISSMPTLMPRSSSGLFTSWVSLASPRSARRRRAFRLAPRRFVNGFVVRLCTHKGSHTHSSANQALPS